MPFDEITLLSTRAASRDGRTTMIWLCARICVVWYRIYVEFRSFLWEFKMEKFNNCNFTGSDSASKIRSNTQAFVLMFSCQNMIRQFLTHEVSAQLCDGSLSSYGFSVDVRKQAWAILNINPPHILEVLDIISELQISPPNCKWNLKLHRTTASLICTDWLSLQRL